MLIFIASSIPNLKVVNVIPETDKYIHIAIFAVFAYLLAGSIHRYIMLWKVVTQILLVFMLTTLFGHLDELHQSTVTGRSYSLRDLLADAAGGFIGAIVYKYIHNRQT